MKKFGVNISAKVSLIIQGLLVFSLIPMKYFFGEITLDFILLYGVIWFMTYLDLSKDAPTIKEL